MWREINLFGVYLPPLLAYIAAAIVVHTPLHFVLARSRFWRWTWNPPLAEAGIFVCVLGLIVVLL